MTQTHEMDRIGFTADGIAARRTLMDLPFAQDIYDILSSILAGTDEEATLIDALNPDALHLVPFFDARYRLLDELIRATGTSKVLELASGLTPRGFAWTQNPLVEYVEFDLPRKRNQKREIQRILELRAKITPRPNLHLMAGDVLNLDDLIKAVEPFRNTGPIVIANEGLLRYLTHDRKRVLASHIKVLLKRFGGWWITPDVNIPEPLWKDPRLKAYSEKIHRKLGEDVTPNLFGSIVEAREFFDSLGFTVKQHSFTKVIPQMVSPARIKMSPEDLGQVIGWRTAFVMKLK
jgi:O-methyltransferase involved in polyketide biosynthesis